MTPKVKQETTADVALLAIQKLTIIIDKRTELAFMIDELWEIIDQLSERMLNHGLINQIRGDLRTDKHYLEKMELERVENALDDLRDKLKQQDGTS